MQIDICPVISGAVPSYRDNRGLVQINGEANECCYDVPVNQFLLQIVWLSLPEIIHCE